MRKLLVDCGLLCATKNIDVTKELRIFLRGVAHAHSYRQLYELFQHSLKKINKHFRNVMCAIVMLADEFINLPLNEVEPHSFIATNQQFYPLFKNSIGAINGTHSSYCWMRIAK